MITAPATVALDRRIDRALLQGAGQALAVPLPAAALAERIRRRAQRLRAGRNWPVIQSRRDRLILAAYAHAAPAGWWTGFCDGSVEPGGDAGIGAILLDAGGEIAGQVEDGAGRIDAFGAESVALAALLLLALHKGAVRLRAHSDCLALVKLWSGQRDDPRLADLRTLAGRFRGLQLCPILRLHNQPAHRLARQAVRCHEGVEGA